MTTLTVLYGVPDDPDAFDEHYRTTHAPLARKIPGLQDLRIRRVVGTPDRSTAPYRLVVDLVFADAEALGAGMGSPEGRAAAADVPTFATGGVTMVISEDVA